MLYKTYAGDFSMEGKSELVKTWGRAWIKAEGVGSHCELQEAHSQEDCHSPCVVNSPTQYVTTEYFKEEPAPCHWAKTGNVNWSDDPYCYRTPSQDFPSQVYLTFLTLWLQLWSPSHVSERTAPILSEEERPATCTLGPPPLTNPWTSLPQACLSQGHSPSFPICYIMVFSLQTCHKMSFLKNIDNFP